MNKKAYNIKFNDQSNKFKNIKFKQQSDKLKLIESSIIPKRIKFKSNVNQVQPHRKRS